jgi:hypothetical protein
MKIKGVYSFLIFSCLTGSIFGQGTTFDVEYAQICLIDSIAPDTVVQFWRFTQANNPGEFQVDRTFDLSATYSPTGTVLPCCSCLTEATAMDGAGFGGGGSIGDIAFSNPAPINALLCFSFLVALVLYFPRRKIFAALLVASPLALSAQPGTVYDVEYTCICLVDSIAADTITQFWRFTQANNPGEFEVDLTFDLSATYTPSGEIIGCKDYYLGDNPGGSGTAGTLAIWTGAHSLGNSNVTESAQILSSSFTGAFKPPAGTTAQQPAGSPGYLRFNTTQSGFEGYNGSAYRFLPWASADNFTSTHVPYSDGNQLTTDAGITYQAATDELTVAENIYAETFRTEAGAANEGLWIGSSAAISILATGSGGNANKYNFNVHSGGNEGWCTFQESGGTDAASIGLVDGINRGVFANYHSGLTVGSAVTYTTRTALGSNAGTATYKAGDGNENNNAGNVVLQAGGFTSSTLVTGTTGIVEIKTVKDVDSTSYVHTLRTHMRFSGRANRTTTQLFQRLQTTTGTQVLTMESDTIKYRIENQASVSTSTDGSGDIVVTHSMGTTPTVVLITVTGTTPYVCTVHTKGGTTFTVRFFDMAGAAVTSTAVTFDWLAKT